MAKLMLSYFDNFPEFNGRKIEIRGKDGYVSVADMNIALGKRFSDWTRTKFAKELLEELSAQLRTPIGREDEKGGTQICVPNQIPLIDYVRERGGKVFAHPTVAFAYAMSDAKFFAKIAIWLTQLNEVGTVNPHILKWTREEYDRGLQYNRDDISEMYGARR